MPHPAPPRPAGLTPWGSWAYPRWSDATGASSDVAPRHASPLRSLVLVLCIAQEDHSLSWRASSALASCRLACRLLVSPALCHTACLYLLSVPFNKSQCIAGSTCRRRATPGHLLPCAAPLCARDARCRCSRRGVAWRSALVSPRSLGRGKRCGTTTLTRSVDTVARRYQSAECETIEVIRRAL